MSKQEPAKEKNKTMIADRPPVRAVRHAFWKYPLMSIAAFIIIAVIAGYMGSPNWPRDTVKSVTNTDPGGTILAFTQELDGTSASAANNTVEEGVGDPGQTFVIKPLQTAQVLLNSDELGKALQQYTSASSDQRLAWASAYDQALGKITPPSMGGDMALVNSPDFSKISTLSGDFGPVPVLTNYDLKLAQSGYLDQYLIASHSDHSLHLVNMWLYDHPGMLNSAIQNGLTDDQWGMVKERGFSVGPWYLYLPSIAHVKLPNGSNGQGFVLWNLLFAAIFVFGFPLIPGLKDLPQRLKLYRWIYRYPTKGELDKPEFAEHPKGYHVKSQQFVVIEGKAPAPSFTPDIAQE